MRYVVNLSLMLSLAGAAVAGDIYCDPHGHDCTDRPTPGWVLVRGDQPRPPVDTPTTTTTSIKAPTAANASSQLEQQKAHQAMQGDLAAKRAEQCKTATDRYEKDIQYRRLYRVDKDGNQTYLSDEEADSERTAAKIQMDQYCGPDSSNN